MAVGTRLVATVVLAGLISTAAAACGGDGEPDPSPSPPASTAPPALPTVSLSPEDAEAAEEILAAFDEYMTAYVELSREGVDGQSEEAIARLEDVPVVGEVRLGLQHNHLTENHQQGRVTSGEITWTAAVTRIHWDFASPLQPDVTMPLATVQVCFDESGWRTVDAETGEVVVEPRGRYLSTVQAVRLDPGQDGSVPAEGWYISSRNDLYESC